MAEPSSLKILHATHKIADDLRKKTAGEQQRIFFALKQQGPNGFATGDIYGAFSMPGQAAVGLFLALDEAAQEAMLSAIRKQVEQSAELARFDLELALTQRALQLNDRHGRSHHPQ